MPRASNRIADQEALLEWSTVVRADGPNREHFIAAAGKEHRFAMCVPKQYAPIRHRCEFNSLSEIRPAEFCLFFAHLSHLEADAAWNRAI